MGPQDLSRKVHRHIRSTPLIRPGDDSKTSFSTIGLDKEIGDSQYMAPNTSFCIGFDLETRCVQSQALLVCGRGLGFKEIIKSELGFLYIPMPSDSPDP